VLKAIPSPPPTGDDGLAPTKLGRFDLKTSDLDGCEGEDGNDADEKEEVSQADDGSTQNVED